MSGMSFKSVTLANRDSWMQWQGTATNLDRRVELGGYGWDGGQPNVAVSHQLIEEVPYGFISFGQFFTQ